jgi:predicted acyltransferase (DUF342 family)
MNSTGTYSLASRSNTGIYYSTNAGQSWILSNVTAGSFGSLALSSTGQYAFAAPTVAGQYVYYSTSYGQFWSPSTTNNASTQVAMSEDGELVLATPGPSTSAFYSEINQAAPTVVIPGVYTPATLASISYNAGSSFGLGGVTGNSWFGNFWESVGSTAITSGLLALSSTGQYAIDASNGIWTSSNYGSSWTASTGVSTSNNFVAVAMATSGQWAVAGDKELGIYYSTTGAGSWTQGQELETTYSPFYVAVGYKSGSSQTTAYSTNGTTWTNGTHIFTGGQGWGVAYGNGLWVAVGGSSTKTAYSTNGINWTNGSNPFSGYGFGVAYGNGLWVAVGSGSQTTAYSINGTLWINGTNIFSGGEGFGVVYVNGLWVAVGHNSNSTITTAYSADGINWNSGTNPFSGSGGLGFGVAYGNGLWVSVGKNSGATITIAYSTNGTLWTNGTNIFSGGLGYGVAYGNGLWVAVGSGSKTTAYSTDGSSWTNGTHIFTGGEGRGVSYVNGLWVAVGNNSGGSQTIAYSPNGTLWVTGTSNPFSGGYGFGVTYANDRWLAVGRGSNGAQTTAYSTNGTTWTNGTNPFSGGYGWGVAFGSGISLAALTITSGSWSSVALSSNKALVAATGSTYSGLYSSTNAGQLWSASNITSGTWADLILDSSGTYGIAAGVSTGIYYSSTAGQKWTVSNITTGTFGSLSMTSSGQYAMATTVSAGPVYWSTNYGQFWAASVYNTGSTQVALSQDGQVAIISPGSSSAPLATQINQIAPTINSAAVQTYPIPGQVNVYNDATVTNRLFVGADVTIASSASVASDLSVNGYLRLTPGPNSIPATAISGGIYTSNYSDDIAMNSRLFVGGDLSMGPGDRLFVASDMSMSSRLFVDGDVSLGAGLFVAGPATLDGDISANARLFAPTDVSLGGNLAVGRGTRLVGDVSTNASMFVLADSSFSRNLFVAKTATMGQYDLSMNGRSRLFLGVDLSASSRVFVASDVSFGSRLFVGGDLSAAGRVFVTSDISLSGRLFVGGDLSLNARLFVGGDLSLGSGFSTQLLSIQKTAQSLNTASSTFFGIGVQSPNFALDISSALPMRLVVGSTTALLIDASGEVGINTPTPAYGLDVSGAALFRNDVLVSRLFANGDMSMGSNLNVSSDASLNARLFTGGDASFNGRLGGAPDNASFGGNLYVARDVTVYGNLAVLETTANVVINSLSYAVIFAQDMSLNGRMYANNDVSFSGRLYSNADVSFGSNLSVQGASILVSDLSVNRRLFVGGDASFGGNVFVNANAVLAGDLSANARLFMSGDASFGGNVFATTITTLMGDLSINNSLFTGADVSLNRNIFVGATAIVEGDVSANSRLFLSGDASFGANLGTLGKFLFANDISANGRIFVGQDASFGGNLGVQVLTNPSGDLTVVGRMFVGDDASINTLTVTGLTNVATDSNLNSRLFLAGDLSMATGANVYVPNFQIVAGVPTFFTDVSVSARLYSTTVVATTATTDVYNINILNFNNLYSTEDASYSTRLFAGSDSSFNTRLFVFGDASLGGNVAVAGAANVVGDLSINTRLFVAGDMSLGGNLFVSGLSQLVGDVSVNSRLRVGGDASFGGSLFVAGSVNGQRDITSASRLFIGGDVSMGGNVAVVGQTVIVGDVSSGIGSRVFLGGDASFQGNLVVQGVAVLGGDVKTSGNVRVQTDLSLGGNLTSGTAILTGDVSANARLFVGGAATVGGKMAVQRGIVGGDLSTNTRLFVGSDASLSGNLFANTLPVPLNYQVSYFDNATFGQVWNAATGTVTAAAWQSVAISGTGSTIVACPLDYAGYLQRSTNSGVSWSPMTGTGAPYNNFFRSVSMSANAQYILCVGYTAPPYLTTNGGVSWLNGTAGLPGIDTNGLRKCAVSVSGKFMITGGNGGNVSFSTNYGTNWTKNPAGLIQNNAYYDVALNDNGYFMASCNQVAVYLSTNYGVNWTSISIFAGNFLYHGLSISDTGQYMIANNFGSSVYYSTNGGANWLTGVGSYSFGNMSVSSSGQYAMAVGSPAPGAAGTAVTKVYMTTSYGQYWYVTTTATTVVANNTWNTVAMTADAKYAAISSNSVNGVYLQPTTFTTSSIVTDLTVSSRLFVGRDASFGGNLVVSRSVVLAGDLSANSRLFVSGDMTSSGNLFLRGRGFFAQDVSFGTSGRLFVTGDLSMASGNFASSGRLVSLRDIVASRVFVSGDAYFNGVRIGFVGTNVVLGAGALSQNTTGANLVALGLGAGAINTTGSRNTFIGASASASAGTFTQSTAIGSNATITGSNQVVIGQTAVPMGDVTIGGRLLVGGTPTIGGNMGVAKSLIAADNLVVAGRLFAGSDVSLGSRLFVSGNVTVGGRLFINDYFTNAIFNTSTTTYNALIVSEDISANNRMYVASDISLGSRLFVRGVTTIAGDISANASARIVSDLSVAGNVAVAQNVFIGSQQVLPGGAGPVGPTGPVGSYAQPPGPSGQTFTVNVTNAGAGAYLIDGVSNATLSFIRGNRYNINVNASGHPFWIQTVPGGYSPGNSYNTGITNNGTDNGTIVFDVPADAPQLFYVCQYHSAMNGSITVSNPIQDLSGSARLFVSGDLTSGGDLFVYGSAYVGGDVSASGRLFVASASAISGKFYVGQGMSVGSDLSASGRLFLAADASLNGNLAVSKKAVVGGDVSSNSRLFVGKDLTVGGNLTAYSGAISKPTTITMPSVTTPTFDLTKGATFYFAPTSAGNFTAAFVNVPTAVNQTVRVTLYVTAATYKVYGSQYSINGSAAATPLYAGAVPNVTGATGFVVQTFDIVTTGSGTVVLSGVNVAGMIVVVATTTVVPDRWVTLGSVAYNGTDNTVAVTLYDPSRNKLYVGGTFIVVYDSSNVNGLLVNGLAEWDVSTSTWSGYKPVGQQMAGVNGTVSALELDTSNNALYVGGTFSSTIPITARYISSYNIASNAMQNISTTGYGFTNNTVRASVLDVSNNCIYVGGDFTIVYDASNGSLPAKRVAKWNLGTSTWSLLGNTSYNGTDAQVNATAYDPSRNKLYVGGNFVLVYDSSNVNGLLVIGIAEWDVNTSRWSGYKPAGQQYAGINGTISALALDTPNNSLYVGGTFSSTIPSLTYYISAYNIASNAMQNISTTGYGCTNSTVSTSVLDVSNNCIYVGGSFTIVYDASNGFLPANRVAKWDLGTSTWSQFGNTTYNGTNNSVNALALDSSNQALYVGGAFTTVQDLSNTTLLANRVAKWNLGTSTWSQFGNTTYNGANNAVNALALDSSNQALYVGGTFTTVQDISNTVALSANRVAKWNLGTSTWSQFGNTTYNGTSGTVNALALDSSNQALYVGGNFTTVQDISNTTPLSAKYVAKWNLGTSTWSQFGNTTYNGVNGLVRALALDASNQALYVGGDFTTVQDISNTVALSANRVAKWNLGTSTWSQFGNTSFNGTSSSAYALAFDSSNQALYVGGDFTTVQDLSNTTTPLSANRVAKWNLGTSTWSQFGNTAYNGTSASSVRVLALDSSNQALYVGGLFTYAFVSSSTITNNIATWNFGSSTWSPFGNTTYNGTSAGVSALALDSSNQALYVGGGFTTVQDISNTTPLSAKNVAKWNLGTSTWFQFGNTTYNGTSAAVNALAIDSSNQALYVGGGFTTVQDISNTIALSAKYVAKWNLGTSTWSQLGNTTYNGTNNIVSALALDASNQALYVGGDFTTVQDLSNTVALSANRVAKWNLGTSTWSQFGNTTYNGTNSRVRTLVLDASNQALYFGGDFTSVNNQPSTITNNIARWNFGSSTWSQFGNTTYNGTNSAVNVLELDASNQALYVGGGFTTVQDISNTVALSANRVAKWNLGTSTWSQFGNTTYNGTSGSVQALAFDSSNQVLYVGGTFTTVQDILNTSLTARRVAKWNLGTSTWSQFGNTASNGTDNNVLALALDSSNQALYVGGLFTTVQDISNTTPLSANRVAKWNIGTSTWSQFGNTTYNGAGGTVNALALDASNQALYVGGNFTTVQDLSNTVALSAKYVAKWNLGTSTWSQFGNTTYNGTNSTVNALALNASNQAVYVGGSFTTVQDISNTVALTANRVAKWTI